MKGNADIKFDKHSKQKQSKVTNLLYLLSLCITIASTIDSGILRLHCVVMPTLG